MRTNDLLQWRKMQISLAVEWEQGQETIDQCAWQCEPRVHSLSTKLKQNVAKQKGEYFVSPTM